MGAHLSADAHHPPSIPVGPRPDLHARLAELATINARPDLAGITREVFTPEYAAATDLIRGWMEAAGLATRLDAFGNLHGRIAGTDPDAPAVWTGSHYDTTLDAGRYDGTVGVLGAIEAVRVLREIGARPRRTIEIIGFAGEEPRFGIGCLGSRALVGALTPDDLERLTDRDGVTLAAALRGAGHDPARIAEARLDPAAVHAFVELHIEQGSVLERHGDDIGVVTAIAAPHDFLVTLRGAARHAGATPMTMRRDALVGAAELTAAVERIARAAPGGRAVATVGTVDVRPGAINIVPGEVTLGLDVRDSDRATRDQVVAEILAEARAIAARRELEVAVETLVEDEPVACDERVVDAVAAACTALGVRHRRMISGAYHDAMLLAKAVPVGMVFVPSDEGISHHPDEHTAPEALDRGVATLAATLLALASDAP